MMLRRRSLALAAVAALGCAACGSDSNPATSAASSSAGAGAGGGGAGGGAGGAGCPEGSHGDGGGCAATLSAWTEGPALTKPRDHHVTFAATTPSGSFLYVAGGTNGLSIFDGVERSAIVQDGTLGAFADGGKLPKGLAGAGLAQVDRSLVLVGGLAVSGANAVSVTDTFVGAIGDDGSLAFTAGPPLLTSRYHVSLSADRGFVYAIGGLQQSFDGGNLAQKLIDAVERAPFDGTTLGDFTALAPLPEPLTHQAAVVHDHALYLIGGISSTAARTDILRATIDGAGDLGAWQPAGQLPEGRATSAAFTFLDQVYVLCGSTKAMGGEVATVLRAPFQDDGTVGAFEELPPLPLARAHTHQAPLLDGVIYSAGGSLGTKFQGEVFLGHLD